MALWRRLTRHLGWKFAALAIAVLLWFTVLGDPELVTIQEVPVLYRNLPRDLLLLANTPVSVRAELRGPSKRLTRASLSELLAALDLSGVTGPGEQTFTFSGAEFSLPQGVTFLRAAPSQVRLNFDRLQIKEVPVEVRTVGSPPAGFRLSQTVAAPARLRISGPEGSVRTIASVQTDVIDISSVTAARSVKSNTFIPDARVQFESPSVVTVTIAVEKIGNTQ